MKAYTVIITALAVTFGAGYIKQHDRAEACEASRQTSAYDPSEYEICADCYEKVDPSEVIPSGMVECPDECFTDSGYFAKCLRESHTEKQFENCKRRNYL